MVHSMARECAKFCPGKQTNDVVVSWGSHCSAAGMVRRHIPHTPVSPDAGMELEHRCRCIQDSIVDSNLGDLIVH